MADVKWGSHMLQLMAQVALKSSVMQSQSSRDLLGCGPDHQAVSLNVFLSGLTARTTSLRYVFQSSGVSVLSLSPHSSHALALGDEACPRAKLLSKV